MAPVKVEWYFQPPNRWTFRIKKIKELIAEYLTSYEYWIDPFVGKSVFKKYCTLTNDLNPEMEADYHIDAHDFLKMFKDNEVDGILFDPPFTHTQITRKYQGYGYKRIKCVTPLYNEYQRIVKPGGVVICFGYNSGGVPPKYGFMRERVVVICHGGCRNDSLVTVCRKVKLGEGKIIYEKDTGELCQTGN